MSKMDAQRAMREAKFARDQARAQGLSPAKRAAAAVAPPAARKTSARSNEEPSAKSPDVAEELCGHRSMNGRTCTRESGHAAKAHRYSAPSK